jgi:inositol phosphorylceramide mannosyltransferase catalytic subunit
MAVPKVVHRIWLDDPMPKTFADYGKEWQRLHPDWEAKDWTSSAELPDLLNAGPFGSAKDLMPKDWKRFQADVLRLELLYLYGGVYADTDVKPLKSFDPWLKYPVVLGKSPNLYHGRSVVTQAIMIAEPGNQFILDCIKKLPGSIARHHGKPLAQVIGPHHIQRTLDSSDHASQVHVVESPVFYPVSIAARDSRTRVDLSNAYASHGWNTTAKKRGKGVR